MSETKEWKTYEEVAAYLLNELAAHFGLERVEGKQSVTGSTDWEVDAKGYKDDDSGFIIVECKMHKGKRVNQATTAALAWTIQDTGASGGILVSPRGLQSGAKKVAASAGICEVKLTAESSTTDYIVQFLDQIRIGMVAKVRVETSLSMIVRDKDGNIIEERNVS